MDCRIEIISTYKSLLTNFFKHFKGIDPEEITKEEILNYMVKDIDSKRMVIHIRAGKGKKDRVVPLAENALLLLRQYYMEYKPNEYLFEGADGGKYSTNSQEGCD